VCVCVTRMSWCYSLK